MFCCITLDPSLDLVHLFNAVIVNLAKLFNSDFNLHYGGFNFTTLPSMITNSGLAE